MSKFFFKGLLIGFILLTLSVFLLIVTPWGNKLAIYGLNKSIDGLNIELAESSIVSSPSFSDVSYHNNSFAMSLVDLKLDWDWHCIWRSAICINSIAISSIDIKITHTDASPTQTPDTSAVELPIALVLKSLDITSISISTPQGQVEMNQLRTAFQAKGSAISKLRVNIDNMNYTQFTSSTNTVTKPFDITQFDPTLYSTTELPALPLNIAIEQINIGNISHSSTAPHSNVQALKLSANLTKNQYQITEFSGQSQGVDFNLSGKIDNEAYLPHKLNLTVNVAKVGDNHKPLKITLSSQGALNALRLNGQTAGLIDLNFAANADLSKQALPFSLQTNWLPLKWQSSQTLAISAGSIVSEGDRHHYEVHVATGIKAENIPQTELRVMATGSDTQLSLSKATLDIGQGTVNATGDLNWHNKLEARLALALNSLELNAIAPEVNGVLSGQVNSHIAFSDTTWKLDLNELDLSGQWLGRDLTVVGQLSGQSNHLPYGQWEIAQLAIANGDNHLTVSGYVNDKVELNAQLTAPDISQSVPQLNGSLHGMLNASGNTRKPKLSSKISINQLGTADGKYQINKTVFNANYTPSEPDPIALTLTLKGLVANSHQIDQAEIIMMGDVTEHKISITSSGAPYQANATLLGKGAADSWQGQLSAAEITTPLNTWQLNESLNISANNTLKKISIANHCWQQQSSLAAICLTSPLELDAQKKQSNSSTITISEFDLAQFNEFIDQPLTIAGELNSTFNFRLRPGHRPVINGSTYVKQASLALHFKERTIAHDFTVLESGLIIDEKLSSINLNAAATHLGSINATLLTNVFSTQPKITGHVEIDNFRLSPYQALIPDLSKVTGKLRVSSGFTGNFGTPLFFGEIEINDVGLATPRLPTTINNLNSKLNLNGQRADWRSNFMIGEGKGQFDGKVDWQDKLIANLSLIGERLTIRQNKDIYAVLSPQLSVQMDTKKTMVRGQVRLDDGLIKIEELPKSAIALSDDVKIKSVKKQQIIPLDLNIKVQIDQALAIDAFGLTSQLQGNLNLIQNPDQALSGYGDLELIDATYKAMGQNLLINKGQLIFTSVLQNPMLNIEAIRDPKDTMDNVTAGLYILGDAKAPRLTIFSTPAMNQQQALSYLLRGRALDSSSNGNNNSMAMSMLLNSGIGQSNQFVGELGDSLGIDNLSLNTSGSGDSTKLEVSGYLAPKLQVRYGVGVFDGTPEVGLRYQLSNKFFIDFVNNTSQTFDLLYKFSFD